MKTKYFLLLSAMVSVMCSAAEPVLLSTTEPVISEKGLHHRVWERISTFRGNDGRIITRSNRAYTELGTGLHYFKDGQWLESKEEIELFQNGAVARQGAHQAIFSPSVTDLPAIDISTPDAKRLQCRLFGLVYRDALSGNNVLIAEPNPDSVAELLPPNHIIWPNALLDIQADLHVVYTKAGVECELILRESPALPTAWNLDPEHTRLQVWTEWFEPPVPQKQVNVVRREENNLKRQRMAEPDIIDESIINFGHMQFMPGRAFRVGVDPDDESIPVYKEWVEIDGRTFLIESVEFPFVEGMLGGLPVAKAGRIPDNNDPQLVKREVVASQTQLVKLLSTGSSEAGNGASFAARQSKVTKSRLLATASSKGSLQLASRGARFPVYIERGVSIDWTLVSASSDFVFRGDTTYVCSSPTTFSGTTVIEGGTVVKYTNAAAFPELVFSGPIDCRTTNGHPAVFTSVFDHSVGEIVGSPTNTPAGTYGDEAIKLSSSGTTFDLHDIHIRYATVGVTLLGGSLNLSHFQIGHGTHGVTVSHPSFYSHLRNGLFHNLTQRAFSGHSTHTNRGEHITMHQVSHLKNQGNIYLTNCLLIAITNNVVFSGSNVETNQNDAGVFQTAGSGKRYLASGSSFRNAGTTNINTDLLAALRSRTTYPPIILSNDIVVGTTLSPQAGRDTDTADLGYHYDPIDYLIGSTSGITVSNATVLLTNGVTMACDASSTSWGVRLHSGASVVSQGTPVNLNRVFWNSCVQETPTSNATNGVPILSDTYPAPATATAASFRFTELPMIAGSYVFNQPSGAGTLDRLILHDAQVRGGIVNLSAAGASVVMAWTNTLFDRVTTTISSTNATTFDSWNNLFREGSLTLAPANGSTWVIKDTFFDKPTLSQSGGSITHDYNGYLTSQTRLTPNGANDVVLTNTTMIYHSGALGYFYLPTNCALINTGSVSAASAGLYHFCTTTNQVKETNSTVDIGYHYVALNAANQPVDGDGDGMPDYFEDANGNGTYDAGETDWQSYNSLLGIGPSPGLRVFTPLK